MSSEMPSKTITIDRSIFTSIDTQVQKRTLSKEQAYDQLADHLKGNVIDLPSILKLWQAIDTQVTQSRDLIIHNIQLVLSKLVEVLLQQKTSVRIGHVFKDHFMNIWTQVLKELEFRGTDSSICSWIAEHVTKPILTVRDIRWILKDMEGYIIRSHLFTFKAFGISPQSDTMSRDNYYIVKKYIEDEEESLSGNYSKWTIRNLCISNDIEPIQSALDKGAPFNVRDQPSNQTDELWVSLKHNNLDVIKFLCQYEEKEGRPIVFTEEHFKYLRKLGHLDTLYIISSPVVPKLDRNECISSSNNEYKSFVEIELGGEAIKPTIKKPVYTYTGWFGDYNKDPMESGKAEQLTSGQQGSSTSAWFTKTQPVGDIVFPFERTLFSRIKRSIKEEKCEEKSDDQEQEKILQPVDPDQNKEREFEEKQTDIAPELPKTEFELLLEKEGKEIMANLDTIIASRPTKLKPKYHVNELTMSSSASEETIQPYSPEDDKTNPLYYTFNDLLKENGSTYEEFCLGRKSTDLNNLIQRNTKDDPEAYFKQLIIYDITRDHLDLFPGDLRQEILTIKNNSSCSLPSTRHKVKRLVQELEERYPFSFTSVLSKFEHIYAEHTYHDNAIEPKANGLNAISYRLPQTIRQSHKINIVVFGSKSSGKSQLIRQFHSSKWSWSLEKVDFFSYPKDPSQPVVYSSCIESPLSKKGKPVVQEWNMTEIPSDYPFPSSESKWINRSLDGAIVMADYSNPESFAYASKVIENLLQYISPQSICMVLNKADTRPFYANVFRNLSVTREQINQDLILQESYDMFANRSSIYFIKDMVLNHNDKSSPSFHTVSSLHDHYKKVLSEKLKPSKTQCEVYV